jgi:hypothetical protein
VPTIKILLEAARAGACSISKLEVGTDWIEYESEEQLVHRDIDKSLLLGLQEFSFRFQGQDKGEFYNALEDMYLATLLELVPRDLKSLVMSSDAELLRADVETCTFYEGLSLRQYPELFKTMQPAALETIHVSRMFLYQNDLLRFLEAHNSSLKKLTLDGVYLLGEWEQILHCVAGNLSLEYFSLSKARKAIAYDHRAYDEYSARIESWCLEKCEVKNSENMRKDIDMFIDLQKAEEGAKQAEKQARLRPQA